MTENTIPDEETTSVVSEEETSETAVEPNAVDPVEQLQTELERYRDLALRTQADLDNYRKRATREKEEAIRFANAGLLEKLLPILDNFELGLSAAKEDETSPIYQGMSMVLKQIEHFLADSGAQPIDAVGQPFDPNKHDAMGQESSEDVPEGVVIRQTRKGYLLRERLLRPASVFVSKGSA